MSSELKELTVYKNIFFYNSNVLNQARMKNECVICKENILCVLDFDFGISAIA